MELGTGAGGVLLEIGRRHPALRLVGSELLVRGLHEARRRLPGVELLQLDARRIPFTSEFDVIGAFDVIEHIDDDEAVLGQMRAALVNGGGIVVTVPQHPWLWSAFDEFSGHRRRYTRRELVAKLTAAGFDVVRVTSFTSFLLPLLVASRQRRRKIDLARELAVPATLNRALLRIGALERAVIHAGASLPLGGSVTVTAPPTVSPTASGVLMTTAPVAPPAGTTDPDLSNDTSTDMTTIAASADLIASKSGTDSVTPPGTVTFTLGVTNAGPSTAQNVIFDDPRPPGLGLPSHDGTCVPANTFPCSVGSLDPGASKSFMVTYSVPAGYTTPDPIVNTVTVTSIPPDPVPRNNTNTANVSVLAPIINLTLTKDDGHTTLMPGNQTTYTMTVTNTGPNVTAIPLVTVTDPVPDALTDVTWTCAAAGGGNCTQAGGTGSIETTVTLPLNASATFTLTGTVKPDATGTLVNTVRAVAPPNFAGNTDVTATDVNTLTPSADLSLLKSGTASVIPGNNVVYTITVQNIGPSPRRTTVIDAAIRAHLVSNAGDAADFHALTPRPQADQPWARTSHRIDQNVASVSSGRIPTSTTTPTTRRPA